MTRTYLYIYLFLASVGCFSQQGDYFFGQLVDATVNEPIPFASIRVKDRALGVISNIDGTFRIPLKYRTLGNSIEFSCMGYKTRELMFHELNEGESNVIILTPSTLKLKEAVVSANIKKLNAKQIVKIAVNSISQNYPVHDFGLVGYYRDYQVRNKKYTNLNEAIVKVMDGGFERTNNFNNQYQLYSYRRNPDFEIDSFAKRPYDYDQQTKIIPNAKMKNDGGNEFLTLVIHDAIRNYGLENFSFIDDLRDDFIENHKFRLLGKTNFKDELVHEIKIDFRNKDYDANGKIFVNVEDFAIHKLEYALSKRQRPGEVTYAVNPEERFSDGFNKLKRELLYHIQIEYVRNDDQKMFLNYISFYNKVLVQRPAPFRSKFILFLRDKSFRIRLNKMPVGLEKITTKDFMVSYKGQNLPIKEFSFLEDERTFIVHPYIKKQETQEAINFIFKKNDSLRISDIQYTYGNIRDSLGNRLDERRLEYLHQYREFFTQETQAKLGMVNVSDLMVKTLPLDSPLQPIKNEAMKNDYWMNTPLQRID